jgi:hypothetical protein
MSRFVTSRGSACSCGAGDGTRTRDNLLGRQELYQLSYSRFDSLILARKSGFVKNWLDKIS